MHKRILFTSIVLMMSFFAISLPLASKAAEEVAITLSPAIPAPGDQVTITLTSFSLNLETADIRWSTDGGARVGGIGATKRTITAKSIGRTTNVTVTIDPVGSARITKYITISPMSVDLLWEATDSTVPPLYRGKALPTSESAIKFTAVPNVRSSSNTLTAASSLVYQWQENYENFQNMSGFGKNSYVTDMDYLNPEKHIGVTVLTREGNEVASSSSDISPVSPKILWYASSPLYGPIFDMAIYGSHNLTQRDVSLYAEPYFFSPGDATSSQLEYTWAINGEEIDTPATPNSIFLTRDESSSGTANIDLSISNVSKLFQQASSNLNLYLN